MGSASAVLALVFQAMALLYWYPGKRPRASEEEGPIISPAVHPETKL